MASPDAICERVDVPKKKYPIESRGFLRDGAVLWRRLTGAGMVVRTGTLNIIRRFELKDGNGSGLSGVDLAVMPVGKAFYELQFVEDPDVLQGYVHTVLTINRIKNGDRVGIQVDPETMWIRKIWPLDRTLRWYQF